MTTSETHIGSESFRAAVLNWLAENCPSSMRGPAPKSEIVWGGSHERFVNPDARVWLERMAAKGWTAPEWPAEYGGGGLDTHRAKILREELRRIDARAPLSSFGLLMLGPVLLEYGTEAQKRRHLPRIVRGEVRWCQGYSEPGAGSDLAALSTFAEDKGDYFLVNGSKIWTSYADLADAMFCLVRTDRGSKHAGISFLLIDMAAPGVEVRPIRLISGESVFCETFFTDVVVPKDERVGQAGEGWAIAKALLGHERRNVSSGGFGAGHQTDAVRNALARIGLVNGKLADPHFRYRLAHARINAEIFVQMTRGDEPVDASVMKILAAEIQQANAELAMDLLGVDALPSDVEPEAALQRSAWLRSKANSIEGGTTEINLNIIATRGLGLPTRRTHDRG